jgi:hypothetical protein
MSFIHKYIQDESTPEPVRHLYSRFIEEFNKQNSKAWNKHVKLTNDDYHRKQILNQGRCNFDNPPFELTPKELIVLYNYYYFPMHYQSSYEIYNILFEENLLIKNKPIFFHDYGCGTLSSTMAFGASFQKDKPVTSRKWEDFRNIEFDILYEYGPIDVLNHLYFYMEEKNGSVSLHEIGANRNAGQIKNFNLVGRTVNCYFLNDISHEITSFVKDFIQENFYVESHQNHFFNIAECTDSEIKFFSVADKFYLGNFNYDPTSAFKSFCNSQKKNPNETVVILNFSYVLASNSIDIDKLDRIIQAYLKSGCTLLIVNQNPDLVSLNKNWELLKEKTEYVHSYNGLQSIKHFGSKSKSKFEVIWPTNSELLFEQFTILFKQRDYTKLEHILQDFFKSKIYNPLLFEIKLDNLNLQNNFDFLNYIADYFFTHNLMSNSGYYHTKAHIYRDINSINIARSYYEKAIAEDGGYQPNCYKVFMNKYFPELSNFKLDSEDEDEMPF